MKKSVRIAVAAALAMGAATAHATNGTNLIGLTANSRAMGGTDIGIARGAGSALGNPALITSVESTEITFGGTLFMPNVSTDGGNAVAGQVSSDADKFVVPEVGLAMKATDSFYWGIGMWGVSGMGVDYRQDNDKTTVDATSNMVTNMQVMQMAVPLAFKTGGLSLGITPLLEYAALDANREIDNPPGDGVTDSIDGSGTAQVLAFGYNLGAAYQVGGLTVGAVYKSEIELNFKDQLQSSRDGLLTLAGACTGAGCAGDLVLTQPAEWGLGGSYKMGAHTVALDYKVIKYKDSKDWGTFGWDDVSVIALGYEYDAGTWQLRAGYNQSKNPISDMGCATDPTGVACGVNYFNLVGFPAIVEKHYTFGGSYAINKQMRVDAAFTYAPEVSQTLLVNPAAPASVTTKHSQTALTLGLNFAF